MPLRAVRVARLLDASEGVACAFDPDDREGWGRDPAVLAADHSLGAPVLETSRVLLDDCAEVLEAAGAFAGLRIGLGVVRVDELTQGGRVTTVDSPKECLEDGTWFARGHDDLP